MATATCCHLVMYLLFQLLCLVLTTVIPESSGGEGAPPKLDGSISNWQSVREGERQVRLNCPVQDDGHVMIHWKKGDEMIGPAWIRFKQRETVLRIKNVALEDAGHYTCEAVNGFGHKVAHITLVVYGQNEPNPEDGAHFPTLPPGSQDSPPTWVKPNEITDLTSSSIIKQIGSSLVLDCSAIGAPIPQVSWYFDGVRLNDWEMNQFGDRLKIRGFQMILNRLIEQDTGRFTCEVESVAGSLSSNFNIRVVSESSGASPEFDRSLPINKTVRVGQTANFMCKVRSSVPPLIKWLKRIFDHSELTDNSTLFQANDMDLVVVDIASNTVPGLNKTYSNQLVIHDVTRQQAGWYICVVTDVTGYIVYRSAHLTVLPYSATSIGGVIPLHLMIGVPLAILLIAVIIYAVYFLHRQQKQPTVQTCIIRPPPPSHPPPSLPSSVRKSPEGASRSAAFYSTPSPEQRYLLTNARNNHWNINSELGREGSNSPASKYRSSNAYYHLEPTACQPLTDHREDWYESTPQPYEIDFEHSELDYGGRTHLQPYPSLYSCNR